MFFTLNFDSYRNVRFRNDKSELRRKGKGQDLLLEEKERQFPRITSFQFCHTPKIENSKISESVFVTLNF